MNANGNHDSRTGVAGVDWRFYLSLVALTAAGFLFIVGIYTLYFGGTASSRVAYAVVMSVIPSCITALVFKLTRLIANWWRMAIVYFVCFWLLQGVLVVVRWI